MRPLLEHLRDGRVRYAVEVRGTCSMPPGAREVPVLAEAVPSIVGGPWRVGEPACWSCCFAWVALLPAGCPEDGLECLACGEATGALPERLWCAVCEWEGLAVAPPSAPRVGRQCGSCRLMAAIVAA